MAKAKPLKRKLPPPLKKKALQKVAKKSKTPGGVVSAPAVARSDPPQLRTTPEGVVLSKVERSPEGVITKILEE